jgi:hypothetical protein
MSQKVFGLAMAVGRRVKFQEAAAICVMDIENGRDWK